jgi:hypothetical protein
MMDIIVFCVQVLLAEYPFLVVLWMIVKDRKRENAEEHLRFVAKVRAIKILKNNMYGKMVHAWSTPSGYYHTRVPITGYTSTKMTNSVRTVRAHG